MPAGMEITVNSEIFERIYFRETSHMQSFVKKSSRNGEITLSITDIGKSCPSRELNVASMSFNAIRKNKMLATIS